MKKILIIDYDQSSLSSLLGVFSGLGYQVVTAADGQIGWDKYNKECPDLVLMEAMLPKVHGFELCQRITSERNTQAKVFIMTGVYKDRVYRTEALRTYGASEYFEKPLKMAELLSSVEAVLGKPEVRPAEAKPAPQPQAPAAEPAPPLAASPSGPEEPQELSFVEPRKREKPRTGDDLFALPDDLNRLSREIPKVRKPAAQRPDPADQQRVDAIADQLLKTVIVEAAAPKAVTPKPGGGNGNGNGNGKGAAEIDQFLRSALAGFDLDKNKVKAAKPAAPPAPPAKVKPVPVPAPPAKAAPAAPAKPSPAPASAPPVPFAAPAAADMKPTLTAGDPGTDVSPFFKTEDPRPAKPFVQPEKKPAPAPVRQAPPRSDPVRREPDGHQGPKPAPKAPEPKAEPAKAEYQAEIFRDLDAPVERNGLPKIVLIGIGVVAVAAAGLILLRPKRPAPVVSSPQETAGTLTPSEVNNQPVEEIAPPVAKPAPAKQKAQPQPKPQETAAASAILPVETGAHALPLPGTANTNQVSADPNASSGEAAASKTQEAAAPGVKTGTETAQNPAGDTAAPPGPAPDTAAQAPSPIPVNEGDLVELASVTEPPKLVKKIDPVYPSMAQRAGREGAITVNALIDEKGNVIETGILKGIQDDRGLARAAETAVRKWKFQPARKNGVAVKVWKPFVIAFKADANAAN